MCTAVTYTTKDTYFGRTFDWEVSYGEKPVFTPRNYPFVFRRMPLLKSHYAMLGIAVEAGNYPLYYDAVNEAGLGMAGLNFPHNTDYKEPAEGRDNITPFEFIPWILGQCASVEEARVLLDRINLVNISFSEQLPLSPLHWIIADPKEAVTVECVKEGLKVYDNPAGVLTNNPPFEHQMFYLGNYKNLSNRDEIPEQPAENNWTAAFQKDPGLCSRGMGALGLPGDWSSVSRFVRTAFNRRHGVCGQGEEESVSQFFHILGSAEVPRGCVMSESGQAEISLYTSCCNLNAGKYYYRTYDNSRITCVDMRRENLDGTELVTYEMKRNMDFLYEN